MATATDLVQGRLEEKENKLSQDVINIEKLIEKKNTYWREERITELEEKKETLETNLKAVKELLNPPNKYIENKRKRMVSRTASNLSEERRVKRRKLGGGAPSKLDSDDERFIANAIESKATYHGRRHGTVMYTNRRVKSRDLKNIANHNLRNRGKKEIKSATTAWNRSAPRNKRSRQAKLHKGSGLFCTKKPPKAEDNDNTNTHHQRCHVKNVQLQLFNNQSEAKYAYLHSMDDKAYVRPGTSEGFEKTRNVRILTACDSARQLPKYDWPEALMYQTPAAHRIMEKEVISVDNKPTLAKKQVTAILSSYVRKHM